MDATNGELRNTIGVTVSRAPVIDTKSVFVGTTDGRLFRYDNDWYPVLEKKITNSPISSVVLWNDYLVVSTTGHWIYTVKKETFEIVDSFDLGANQSAIFGHLELFENYFVAQSSRNRVYLFELLSKTSSALK